MAKFRVEGFCAAVHRDAFNTCGGGGFPEEGSMGVSILCPRCETILDFHLVGDNRDRGFSQDCVCGQTDVCIQFATNGIIHIGPDFP